MVRIIPAMRFHFQSPRAAGLAPRASAGKNWRGDCCRYRPIHWQSPLVLQAVERGIERALLAVRRFPHECETNHRHSDGGRFRGGSTRGSGRTSQIVRICVLGRKPETGPTILRQGSSSLGSPSNASHSLPRTGERSVEGAPLSRLPPRERA